MDKQGRRREYTSAYLRRTYRDGGAVRNETVANLSMLPPEAVDAIEATLKGARLVPVGEAVTITRSLPHGHVAAVAAMAHQLGLPALLGPAVPGARHRGGVDRLAGGAAEARNCPRWPGGTTPPSGRIWAWPARPPTRSTPRWTGWPAGRRRSSASSRQNT